MTGRVLTAALAAAALAWAPGPARAEQDVPAMLSDVGIDQRLGGSVPLDLVFRDEEGRQIRLGDLFDDRPVLLTLNYYECPMLCTLALNGLVRALRPLRLDLGRDFTAVTVSIDPGETPELAAAARDRILSDYGRPGSAGAWHFLTGESDAIESLAEAVGFRYAYDPDTDEYAHAAGVILLTSDGRISRYFYGVEPASRDLRLGLVESSEGKIGTLADQVLLFCYSYDPASGTYGAAIVTLMRIGGVLTVAAMVVFFIVMRRRELRLARGESS